MAKAKVVSCLKVNSANGLLSVVHANTIANEGIKKETVFFVNGEFVKVDFERGNILTPVSTCSRNDNK